MPVRTLRPRSWGRCPGHHRWDGPSCAVGAHLVQVRDQRGHRLEHAPVEETSDVQ